MNGPTAVVLFVVGLIGAIMLHEAGHYLTAKRFGIRADRFFLGFGPTLWSTQRGETEFGVKALPLGGFVRIKGMSPLDERRGPLPDEAFAPDRVALDLAGRTVDDLELAADGTVEQVDGVPETTTVPEATWGRLERSLRERGTPRDVGERIVRRTRQNAGDGADLVAARSSLVEVLAGELPSSVRAGDLTHRIHRGDEQRFFADKPAWQRAIVLAAGSAVHFAIAVALLLVVSLFLPTVTGLDARVDDVLPGTPAEAGGLEVGDRVLAVEGVASSDYERLRELIQARPGEPTDLLIDRDGDQLTLTLTPEAVTDELTGESVGQVGFAPTPDIGRLPVDEAFAEAFTGPAGFFTQVGGTFQAIGNVFGPEGLGSLLSQATGGSDRDEQGAVSLVGAANVAGQAAAFGIAPLLILFASINIFIGVFNLLPLPPLDGGHLAVLGIERAVNGVRRLRGRAQDFTVDPRAIAAVAVPVLTILAFVFFSLLWLDITNPIQLPS